MIHLNLLFPQWQGSGRTRDVYYGALKIKEVYLSDIKFEEIKICDNDSLIIDNDMRMGLCLKIASVILS